MIKFTKEDNLLLDFLNQIKIIFNYIQIESTKFTINISNNNMIPHSSKVVIIDNDTKKEETVSMIPLGNLIGNTFYWFHPNIRALFLDTTENFIKIFHLDKIISNTILKFFNDDKIDFIEKYRDSIPFMLSCMYNPNKTNILRFLTSKEGDFEYFFIQIPLSIPKNLIDRIVIEMQMLDKSKKEFYTPARSIKNKK